MTQDYASIQKLSNSIYPSTLPGLSVRTNFKLFLVDMLAPLQFSPFVEEQRRFAMLMLKCTFQKNKVKEAVNFVDKSGNKLQFLMPKNQMVLKK